MIRRSPHRHNFFGVRAKFMSEDIDSSIDSMEVGDDEILKDAEDWEDLPDEANKNADQIEISESVTEQDIKIVNDKIIADLGFRIPRWEFAKLPNDGEYMVLKKDRVIPLDGILATLFASLTVSVSMAIDDAGIGLMYDFQWEYHGGGRNGTKVRKETYNNGGRWTTV